MKRRALNLVFCALGALSLGTATGTSIVNAIDGSPDVSGLPGSAAGWGFSVTADPGVYPLFTGSQFTPDPNSAGTYTDYLALNFFYGQAGATVTNSFDPLTLSGAGEFDINAGASIGSTVVGSLELFWDEYSVSPGDPSFDPQADLLTNGNSGILNVSVTVGSEPVPVTVPTPEPSTFWLALPGVIPIGWRIARHRHKRERASEN